MSDADNPRKRGRRSSPSPGPKNQDDSNHWAEDDENHAYHNPEPPPDSELAQNAEPVDRSYIISCLRKLLPAGGLDQKTSVQEQQITSSSADEDLGNAEYEKEEACCFLWDVTISPEQAEFLHEHHVVPILLHIISEPQKHSDRLLEAAIGVLANITSVSERVAGDVAQHAGLLDVVCETLKRCDDPPILAELLRLFSAGVSSKAARSSWLAAIQKDTAVPKQLLFMIANTLNATLMEKLSSLFCILLWYCDAQLRNELKPVITALIDCLAQQTSISSVGLRPYSTNHLLVPLVNYIGIEDNLSVEKALSLLLSLVRILKSEVDESEEDEVVVHSINLLANLVESIPAFAHQLSDEPKLIRRLIQSLGSADADTKAFLWTILHLAAENLQYQESNETPKVFLDGAEYLYHHYTQKDHIFPLSSSASVNTSSDAVNVNDIRMHMDQCMAHLLPLLRKSNLPAHQRITKEIETRLAKSLPSTTTPLPSSASSASSS